MRSPYKSAFRANDQILPYGTVKGENLLIVDCHPGPAHAFQRAHLVDARFSPRGGFSINFRTHTVIVSDKNAKAIFDEVLEGKVSVLAKVNVGPGDHIRVVKQIEVVVKDPVRVEPVAQPPTPPAGSPVPPSQPPMEPTYEQIMNAPRKPSKKIIT